MMELTQRTLRGILAQILSVDNKYVVPKQANWYNPQEQAGRPDTWCAYQIVSNTPRAAPYYHEVNGVNVVCTPKIAKIALQFVGRQAEEVAQSVANWSLRTDVKKALSAVQGSMLYSGGEVISSYFGQDGSNSIMAFNTTVNILWISCTPTSQNTIKTIDIGGRINV